MSPLYGMKVFSNLHSAPPFIDSPIDSLLKPSCIHVDDGDFLNDHSLNPSDPDIQSICIYCPRRYAVQGQDPSGEQIDSFSLLRVF